MTSEQTGSKDVEIDWTPILEDSIITTLLAPNFTASDGQIHLPELDGLSQEKLPVERSKGQKTSLLALQQAFIIKPEQFSDIEEPNDELITTLAAPQKDINLESVERKVDVCCPPMPCGRAHGSQICQFCLLNPPLQTPQIKLHRRFSNVLTEVERIKIMLVKLGIIDSEPEQ